MTKYDVLINQSRKNIDISISGTLRIPSSKSLCHRVLICASLSNGCSYLDNILFSEDIDATMNCLSALGARFEKINDASVKVSGICNPFKKPIDLKSSTHVNHEFIVNHETRDTIENHETHDTIVNHDAHKFEESSDVVELYCNESGSTLRFMIPIASALSEKVRFYGNGKLVSRPLGPYIDILKSQGLQIGYNGVLPLEINGHMVAEAFEMPGDISSQFISGLLLAAPVMNGNLSLTIGQPLESKAYVDLTVEAMEKFGIQIERKGYEFFSISEKNQYISRDYTVEGDYSQASFWIVAGTLIADENGILLEGLNRESLQGDLEVIQLVKSMGGNLVWEESGLRVYRAKTHGIDIDASQCPDIIPVMGVLGAFSEGITRVYNGKRLRIKESDRILSTITELRKMGVEIEELEDGFIILSSVKEGIQSVVFDGWNDHRIVMAMAIASLKLGCPVEIKGAEAVNKSYPNFFQHYKQIGGDVIEQYIR